MNTKSFRIVLAIFTLLGMCQLFSIPSACAADPVWNICSVPLERVTVVAHRGAGDLAPENTMEALNLTWKMGGTPEVDIRTTSDGVLVMFHDSNFRRTLPNASEEMKKKGIEHLTWSEVQQLDIGSWRGEKFAGQRVVSLAQIVNALKQDPWRQVFIDVKKVDFQQLAKETSGVHSQIILATGNYQDLGRWKKVAPTSEAFYWMGLGKGDDVLGPKIDELEKANYAYVDRMQIHVIFDKKTGKTTPSEEFLRKTAAKVHARGNIEFQLMPWNAPDRTEYYFKLFELGAGGLGTDRPDVAFAALRQYYQKKSTEHWNVREHIARKHFIIQAHRGFGNYGPEGSDDSFERAWKIGLVPEADLRLTKDKHIVSFHDDNFQRILPNAAPEFKKKRIADLTLAEVKKLDIGAFRGEQFKGQHALSMADIVAILRKNPDRLVYLDIKNVDFGQLACETEGVHKQIIVASTQYPELVTWKKVAPRSLTIHWMGGSEEKLRERLDALEKVRFAGIDQLQIHVNIDKSGKMSPGESFLKETGIRLRKYGILFQTLIWGKPGALAENYWKLMDLGCASFATDYPDATKAAIDEYYQK